MNRRLLLNVLGKILIIEAGAMALCLAVSMYYRDGDTWALAKAILLLLAVGLPMWLLSRPKDMNMRARRVLWP